MIFQKLLWSSWNAFEYPRRQGMLSGACTQKDKDCRLWRNSKSQPCHSLILTLSFMELTEMSSYFMQDSAMANMTNFSMIAPEGLFSKQVIISGLWAHRFSDVKHCNYSLCRRLKACLYRNPMSHVRTKINFYHFKPSSILFQEIFSLCSRVA